MARIKELRRDIRIGLDQLKRGEGIPGAQVFEELRQISEARRREQGRGVPEA